MIGLFRKPGYDRMYSGHSGHSGPSTPSPQVNQLENPLYIVFQEQENGCSEL